MRATTLIATVGIVLGGCTSDSNDAADSVSASTAVTASTLDVSAAVSAPTSAAASSAAASTERILDQGFVPLNPAVGYGTLRLMSLAELPGERDVVVYETLPNEMPRVAGVITTVAQTPLSHVNLRAVQDKVPNAYIAGASSNSTITGLLGRYVRYEVTTDGYSVTAATQAEVEAHFAASRPTTTQTPERDLSVRAITPLAEIGFADWKAFGVKASNVATLATFDLPADVPDGYAVPFAFYDEFMTATGLYATAREMLADEAFRTDPDVQAARLDAFREEIKSADMPSSMMTDLDNVQRSFPKGTPIRCRSSTNNEDLPDFNGAGLYDSFTQHPDEGHLEKCIKQVYASVWNLRAFLEREFYRVDHLATAMAVLLHPNAEGEQVNGVAVTTDPIFGGEDFYLNAQVGEDLVTNPEAKSIPEETLLRADGSVQLVSRSNLADGSGSVLSDAQLTNLRSSLTIIRDRFAELYDVAEGTPFAMEIEFKITEDGALSIKQARRWVFG